MLYQLQKVSVIKIVSAIRHAVIRWLSDNGPKFRGSVLHVGSKNDYYVYRNHFPNASRYRNLDIVKWRNVDIVADVQNMPQVDSEGEDCVIATFMLYAVSNGDAAFSEFCRILKVGGVLVVTFSTIHGGEADRIRVWTEEEALALVKKYFKLKHCWKIDFGKHKAAGLLVIAVKENANTLVR